VAITDFSLDGRVAVKADTKGYSANLQWRHAGKADSLRLLSPVGTVIAQLQADAGGAELVTADKQVHRSGNVQELTRQVLGWDLPLDGLQHWVLGRADPALPVETEQRDARGRLQRFTQNGWRISYLAYAGDGALPARLTLLHERLSLRLVIDRWDIPE
jgi:outer membrane lipoprotein LolB